MSTRGLLMVARVHDGLDVIERDFDVCKRAVELTARHLKRDGLEPATVAHGAPWPVTRVVTGRATNAVRNVTATRVEHVFCTWEQGRRVLYGAEYQRKTPTGTAGNLTGERLHVAIDSVNTLLQTHRRMQAQPSPDKATVALFIVQREMMDRGQLWKFGQLSCTSGRRLVELLWENLEIQLDAFHPEMLPSDKKPGEPYVM